MVEENNIYGEEYRHYPSRRGNRGRVVESVVGNASSPTEVIRSLPATSADSPLSRERWISPKTVAADRLSAVVMEANRREEEARNAIGLKEETDAYVGRENENNLPHNLSLETTVKAVEAGQVLSGKNVASKMCETEEYTESQSYETKNQDFINNAERVAFDENHSNQQDLQNEKLELAATVLGIPESESTSKTKLPIFEAEPEPMTITDTQSALTATQVKAEIRRQKKKRRRRRRLVFSMVLLLILAIIGSGFYAGIKYSPEFAALFGISNDYEGEGHGEVLVNIPRGANGTQIGEILVKYDVIASLENFVDVFNKNQYAQGVQSGVYKMAKQMSAKEALARLLDPKYKADEKITIPEGFKVEQIKKRILKTTDFKAEDVEVAFVKATKEYLPPQAKGKLEGWIAPDTYILQKDDTPEKLLKKMINNQLIRLKKLGVKPDQYETVLIKASILEKEVSKPEDMGKVARVIENRIKQGSATDGLLQMCSTVVYGLDKDIIIPTDEELKIDTPYNTYIHPGLPPYPIGSPGEAAIKATLNPTPGDWVYFATVNLETGETRFANTKEEHDKNVAQLREYCNNKPEICKKKN